MKLYEGYRFLEKDPVIDVLRTAIKDEGVSHIFVATKSGVTVSTLRNWFVGKTKRPQFATVMAVARSIGYDYKLVKTGVVSLSEHRKRAK